MALQFRPLALAGCLALGLTSPALAEGGGGGGGVTISSYGHSALLIQGGGATVLLNPFKAVGCAAGLAEPRVSANVILASSRLMDEGAAVASGTMLSAPGSYRLAGLRIEGIAVAHDRFGGRRFVLSLAALRPALVLRLRDPQRTHRGHRGAGVTPAGSGS